MIDKDFSVVVTGYSQNREARSGSGTRTLKYLCALVDYRLEIFSAK